MDSLLKIAIAELGEKEIPGAGHNPDIIRYAHEAGFTYINDDETPWCSIFVNWCVKKVSLRGSNKLDARSWLFVGESIESPEPADVVIFWREKPDGWKGHVGFFLGFSKDTTRVYCLGGNQGNQVSISAYPVTQVLGFRRLVPSTLVTLPEKILSIGSTGKDVKHLQQALKIAGFHCGTSDGIFGAKTETAIKAFQGTRYGLRIDGVFDEATRVYLLEILNQ